MVLTTATLLAARQGQVACTTHIMSKNWIEIIFTKFQLTSNRSDLFYYFWFHVGHSAWMFVNCNIDKLDWYIRRYEQQM